jgi:hypothetical protein
MGLLEAHLHGVTHVLRALAQRPTLTKLGLRNCGLGLDEARLLRIVLSTTPSLQSLDLANNDLEGALGWRNLH